MLNRRYALSRGAEPFARLLAALSAAAVLSLVVALPATADDDLEDGDLPELPPTEISVVLEEGHTIEELCLTWGLPVVGAIPEMQHYLLDAAGYPDVELLAQMIAADPAVDAAEPNWPLQGPEVIRQMVVFVVGGTWDDVEDQLLADRIGLAEAHLYNRGAGVTVAVLDTGVEPEHEALQGRLLSGGFDLVDGDADPWESANGIDDDGDGLVDGGYGHGTMVAGLVALVAPEARILPIRLINDEGATDLFLVGEALHHALDAGADVINMSFGVKAQQPGTLRRHLEACAQAGIIMVAGAGNDDNEMPPYYPAANSYVVMVTAADSLDLKADFADFHPSVDLSAPGTGVRSAYPGGQWAIGSGCSFATPLVSGEAALIVSRGIEQGRDAVLARLAAAVENIYALPGNAPYQGLLGTGRIDLPLAVNPAPTAAPELPASALALRAFPNPFRSEVRLALPAGAAGGTVAVYGPEGRLLRRLAVPASGQVLWDGRDRAGHPLPAGIYLLRASTPAGRSEAHITLLR